jgi:divinyl protochlorophyllide a 8-vinyl-reductase
MAHGSFSSQAERDAAEACIRKHAWTFIGAGVFTPEGAWSFSIDRCGAGDSAPPPGSLFHWYAAVFTRLYARLVAPDCQCRVVEPACDLIPARAFAITRTA